MGARRRSAAGRGERAAGEGVAVAVEAVHGQEVTVAVALLGEKLHTPLAQAWKITPAFVPLAVVASHRLPLRKDQAAAGVRARRRDCAGGGVAAAPSLAASRLGRPTASRLRRPIASRGKSRAV
jgi:hypothetical protein